MDIPVESVEVVPPVELVRQCAREAAWHYQISPALLMSVIEVEGGKIGTISKNKNGSHDLGVMQINTINLPAIEREFGFSWHDLVYSPCLNIVAGAWFLAYKIAEAGDIWTGVGNYHSKTPEYHQEYLDKVTKSFSKRIEAATSLIVQTNPFSE